MGIIISIIFIIHCIAISLFSSSEWFRFRGSPSARLVDDIHFSYRVAFILSEKNTFSDIFEAFNMVIRNSSVISILPPSLVPPLSLPSPVFLGSISLFPFSFLVHCICWTFLLSLKGRYFRI